MKREQAANSNTVIDSREGRSTDTIDTGAASVEAKAEHVLPVMLMRGAILTFCLAFLIACSAPSPAPSQKDIVHVQKGDLAKHGGTPTIRREYERQADDPSTTNDESNDQPLGHFGTVTLSVIGPNGNPYTLDADVDDNKLERLYFPKGGWLDFDACELDDDLNGECTDENGKDWTIEGEA
jgi:hypothetical protein